MANKVIDPAPIIKELADRCLKAKGLECSVLGSVIDLLKAAPAVDAVEVVHGRWISYLDGDSIMPERYYRCSECCDRGWKAKWPYCPNCGAKMDGDGNA